MADRVHQNPQLIFSVGTQIVTLRNIVAKEAAFCMLVVRSGSSFAHPVT